MISIPVTLTTMTRMKAAKSWRIMLELPADVVIAAPLTKLIDRSANVTLHGDRDINIHPAFIENVVHKGKKFFLSIETMTPKQSDETAPYIMAMIGEQITVHITPETDSLPVFAEDKSEEKPQGKLSEHVLKGLHVAWFKNRKFWQYIEYQQCVAVESETMCKDLFKKMMNVESCKDIDEAKFKRVVEDFTRFINQR